MIADCQLVQKLKSTCDLPTLPAVLMPLLRYLERPLDSQDMHEIVRLISQDETLAARCLQLANSPLYGCSHEVQSIQSAVVSLGLQKIHEIAVSCSLLKLASGRWADFSPAVFWAHSLACALVSREFAIRIGFPLPPKAYAAGLLHDIGVVALLWAAPQDFRRALQMAHGERIPLHEAEQRVLGITHADAGRIVGQCWGLPSEIVEVIAHHHCPQRAPATAVLASIVCVSDLLCRLHGIGHGQQENCETNFIEEPAFTLLTAQFSALHPFDWARFTFEMEGLVAEVQETVSRIYGAGQ